MYDATKVLSHMNQRQSLDSAYKILQELGEELPRPTGDPKLMPKIAQMNAILNNTTDETLLSIALTNDKKFVTLMKLYILVTRMLQFTDPSLVASTSLRMVELTLNHGLCFATPMAFTLYGVVLATAGMLDLSTRLARVALKLVVCCLLYVNDFLSCVKYFLIALL